jgi:hypothetical protein
MLAKVERHDVVVMLRAVIRSEARDLAKSARTINVVHLS